MERLTTNKSVADMSMIELAHNSCYVDDEGNARYRDYEMEMDARDFARNLMVTLAKDELPVDDAEFDEEILDNLTIDPFSDVRGLIALFYRNMWAMADLREKLKDYEDAEEQGLLLRLPCGIGADVYIIPSKVNCELNILSLHPENNKVYHQKVALITFAEKGWYIECNKDREYGTDRILPDKMYKETWFLSQEEAEAKLKEMEEKDGR
ncbi:hypothetical protein [Roseburia inulinivorans]|jgi:hypothetical protein|uniref:Uncharacterized protein n=1 Tax=Roseburia inulinivorans TaxID=360807 RepID=A0A3R5WF03_9FIRM|nr:hypothetical protein [Roseburia inulinivorans]RGR67461.1 hypothetical protein DWY29_10445 [Roseburia inulinivorans]DAZ35659.1 MAG TPA: hypothetical protein [Caudoviricetes sp.]